ncbi:MAG: sugar transferase [Solirubrobacterales bacterium]
MSRRTDVALAALALVVASPLLALIAVVVRLTSPGPVLYRQTRVRKGGAEFELRKFRTMRPGSDPVGIGTAVGESDPRVTAVGRLLRRTSLDELPNLFDFLRGEMAIVGPRPTIPAQVELYTPHQLRRREVKPGLTGWAQVSGHVSVPWEERIELDVFYVEHRSPAFDRRIIARTVRLVLGGGLTSEPPSSRVPREWESPPPE